MKGKHKTLFITGLAVALAAYAIKHSKKEDKLWQNISAIVIPAGLVLSTIAYLTTTD